MLTIGYGDAVGPLGVGIDITRLILSGRINFNSIYWITCNGIVYKPTDSHTNGNTHPLKTDHPFGTGHIDTEHVNHFDKPSGLAFQNHIAHHGFIPAFFKYQATIFWHFDIKISLSVGSPHCGTSLLQFNGNSAEWQAISGMDHAATDSHDTVVTATVITFKSRRTFDPGAQADQLDIQ